MVIAKRYRLLLADDDPGFRGVLREILGPYFHLVEAATGREAVEIGEQERFDIALLDMHMPQLTGLEAVRILKAVHTEAPYILITADESRRLQRTASEADIYSVLHKPITRQELVSTVSTAIEDAYADADVFADDFEQPDVT